MTRFLFLTTVLLSAINLYAQDKQKIENLTVFTRAYGYVKYFHPGDEASETDWEKFAAYGCMEVEKCRTREQLINALDEIFKPVAPTIRFYKDEEQVQFDLGSIVPADTANYKPVYWQHKGVSTGMKYTAQAYKSVRVNAVKLEQPLDDPGAFGNLLTYINAEKYRGKQIKLTGSVKLIEGSKGTGHLWLRVDRKNNVMGSLTTWDKTPLLMLNGKPMRLPVMWLKMPSGLHLAAFCPEMEN